MKAWSAIISSRLTSHSTCACHNVHVRWLCNSHVESTGQYGGRNGPRTDEFIKMIYLYRLTLTLLDLIAQPKVPQSKHSFLCRIYSALLGSSGIWSESSCSICGGAAKISKIVGFLLPACASMAPNIVQDNRLSFPSRTAMISSHDLMQHMHDSFHDRSLPVVILLYKTRSFLPGHSQGSSRSWPYIQDLMQNMCTRHSSPSADCPSLSS